jgi:hypothetical protein
MDARLLCIADPNGRVACFLKAGDENLEYVSGTPGAETKIGGVLIDLSSRGVHARVERLTPGIIDVDEVKIGPDDPRFLDRAAAEFRVRGWSACVYPRPLAAVWRKMYVLPVPQEVRISIAEHLDDVPQKAVDELDAELDRAAAELDRVSA